MQVDIDDLEFQLKEAMTFNGYNGLTDDAVKTIWEAANNWLTLHQSAPDENRKALEFVRHLKGILTHDHDNIATIERALLKGGLDEWLPIETAPKDGTWILGIVKGAEIPCVVQWRDFKGTPLDRVWLKPKWCECIEGFESDEDAIDHLSGTDYSPTYWQPLPTAPEPETTA